MLASAIGTTIEWYDFFIYGLAASLVFNTQFFTKSDPATGTIIAFATFAVGYLGRPVGALIFGHFGDRVGRKTALVTTMMMMGIGTFAIGCLPTYAQIGVAAPILLTVLRIIQGIGIAGEWGGAVLLAVEHAPPNRRGLYGSWPQIGVPVGLLLATGAFTLLTSVMSDAAFQAWGWRIAFLLSAVLVVAGLIIRLRILESPAFQQLKDGGSVSRTPILEVVRHAKKPALLGMGTKWAEGVAFNTWAVFSIAYLSGTLGLPKSVGLIGVMIAAAVAVLFIPIWGYVSDRTSRLRVYGAGALVLGLSAFPAFAMFGTGSPVVITVTLIVVLGVAYPLMFAPQAALYSELFPAHMRYSGISIVFQFASIVSSGFTPLILASLLARGNGSYTLVAGYIAAVAAVSTLCLVALRRVRRYTDEPADTTANSGSAAVPELAKR
ncbi:MFS transporter [Micromonospora sp. NPDC005161]